MSSTDVQASTRRGSPAPHGPSARRRRTRIDTELCRGTMGGMPNTSAPTPAAPSSQASGVCCAPLGSAPLTERQAGELANVLKAVADPTRMRLLSLMMANENLEACTCDLTDVLGLSQPTITHHLKKLVAAGLVRVRRRAGAFTYYQVVPEALAGLTAVFAPAATPVDAP